MQMMMMMMSDIKHNIFFSLSLFQLTLWILLSVCVFVWELFLDYVFFANDSMINMLGVQLEWCSFGCLLADWMRERRWSKDENWG